MKILHFGKFYPPFNGGMETYLRDLAEQQNEKHTVTVLVHNHLFKKLTSKTESEKINGVNIIRQKTLKPILFTPIMLGLNKVINNLFSKNKFDVIHISWPNPSALLLLFNKQAQSTHWVIQWQSDMITKRSSWMLKLAYQFFKPFEKRLIQHAKKIIVSTEEYFSHSIALKPFRNKCSFIPLGMKYNDIIIEKKQLSWANDLWNNAQYKIYSIGRLTFYKNHQIFIHAAKLMPDAMFIITGSGDLGPSLNKEVSQKSLSNITFSGNLPKNKLNALIHSCDIFCLASNDRAESFGMVLLEAIQQQKPILVSDLKGSGMKWIASQVDKGYTFDHTSAHDLIGKIKIISKNTKSTYKPENILTIEQCANDIDQIYSSLV